MKANKKLIIITSSALVIGLFFGWLFFGGSSKNTNNEEHQHQTEVAEGTIWTCSMHPQIRQNEPGKCPLCGMDLIPLNSEEDHELDPMAVSMSPTAMQLANVSTAIVGRMAPVKSVRLNGKVQADERLVYSQSTHLPGRIEKLTVNFTGEYVNKGQIIAYIYSPELVTAQEELFEAQKIAESQPQLFKSAKEKLKNWKLSEKQIEQILKNGSRQEEFPILADVSGYVTRKKVNLGDYVRKGETIYEIADLSRVWILFDVYESDIPWIKKGDMVSFTVASLPGDVFKGNISYLDPVIDPKTRVARARIESFNSNQKLKPEMFVSGTVEAKLPGNSKNIVVPKTSVMWTGKRSVVYVKSTGSSGVSFLLREVTLGPALGDSYVVEEGLEEGEEIAVNGTFSIDAAAQLAGKPSMMNPEGGKVSSGHNHGNMNMNESENNETAMKMDKVNTNNVPDKFKVQLNTVVNEYLKVKDDFFASNAAEVDKSANGMKSSLEKVDMKLLKDDGHIVWMDMLKMINLSLDKILKGKNIDEKRVGFRDLSKYISGSIEKFGVKSDKALYLEFCPMADENRGAYWISASREIQNPYFGAQMPTCGEVKKTYN